MFGGPSQVDLFDYMPAAYQGTVLRSAGDPILNLHPPDGLSREMQRSQIDLIQSMNAEHLRDRPGNSELQARIASYELAFQLQSTAPEALDLSTESEATRSLYGIHSPKGSHPLTVGPAPFGRQCLIARRLVERGVRFIQIYSGGGGDVKGGISYGETDELGQQAAIHPHHLGDLHATILHLMGLDPGHLTYFYGGLENKLTGVIEPEIIRGILA
jgi:hypothetical protein